MLNAVYLHEDFVEMRLPLSDLAHIVGSPLADFSGEMRAEPIDPEPDTFMADVDTALVEQVFDIPKG